MNHSRAEIDDRRRLEPNSVLVARRSEPSQSAVTDLSNVVPFARRRAVEAEFPLASVAVSDRPAPSQRDFGVGRRIALLTGSLILHGLLLATFWRDAPPLASIGIESMSVEITLGTSHAAGLAPQSGEQEIEPLTTTEERSPEVTAEAAPQETPRTIETTAQAREHTPTDAPPEKKTTQQKQVAAAPTDSAGGVGRGRSDASSNYDGLVAAHLQRYKQYPAAARKARSKGVATVSFTVDEAGRVTSVELAQTSGVAALDQEVVAMVRRASPFPRPPDRRSRDFNVPVRFN